MSYDPDFDATARYWGLTRKQLVGGLIALGFVVVVAMFVL